ncbi:MAG: nucleotidyl transferase AbiEii/AbiGii toxin family protein [Candidatus Gracilibacteria bacterium]|nr:nucleotidyl transferase AbiEii/AbiGii toxin family protein [Candidatus Gracilibacteria bacterium]
MGLFSFFKKSEQREDRDLCEREKKEVVFDELSKKVLSKEQQKLKPLLEYFSTVSFLGGGTAIALQLGHRKSIDFDFMTDRDLHSYFEFEKIVESHGLTIDAESRENYRGVEGLKQDEIHVKIDGVNFTIFNFYKTLYRDQQINIIGDAYMLGGLRVANLEELACMKLYAMITRNKWKDAVDLYFILKSTDYSLVHLFDVSKKYFEGIFRQDIVMETLLAGEWDKSEQVEYIIENPPTDLEIVEFLKKEVVKLIQ